MLENYWHTPAALSWMQIILQERFGCVFVLQPQSDRRALALHLQGNERYITLELDGLIFTRSDSDLPCTQWNAATEGWNTALGTVLPAPGRGTDPGVLPLIESTPYGYHIHYDILGLTYWMLTRHEEVGRKDLDIHGRFSATSSHAFKYSYLERPIVDEWLYMLGQVVTRTWPALRLKQQTFSMKVSHDVDAPSRYGFASAKSLLRAMAGDIFKNGNIKNAIRAPWIRRNTRDSLHPADPFNTFEWIMDVSERNGLISSFYFISGRTSNKDADYDLSHPTIRALMRQIHERGHEIGLHPSYETYQQPELLVQEARNLKTILTEENIRQSELGGRMHYLRWEQPTTLRAWAVAGLDYDSTLCYADLPGFRCGTCFEYPAFDSLANQALNLRIRPLIVMECTVIDERYMGLGTGEASYEKFIELKNTCRALNGSFTLLWHNSELEKVSKKILYKSLVESS